jgi:L-histidine N-alpha-methyltransferase
MEAALRESLDFHPSAGPGDLQQARAAALRSNRIDPKFLYISPRQAELWREVSLRHAPVQREPEFRRIYEDAFARVAERNATNGEVTLIGLGAGTGRKEGRLCAHLHGKGRDVSFSVIDVSGDLVAEAIRHLVAGGARHRRSLVCDLGQIEAWQDWLAAQYEAGPRVLTFFGLVPNFLPSQLGPLWRAALRRGDILLASVHLAPVAGAGEGELSRAMRAVLPQYDNAETLAWLRAALPALDLESLLDPVEMAIGEVAGIPALIGSAKWKTDRAGEPLRLFSSLRYTPGGFETLLASEGFAGERLALTRCREEGVWCIRLA